MTFSQLKKVLGHIREVHYEAARKCDQARDDRDERANLLSIFLQRSEKYLGRCLDSLDSLESEQNHKVINTWVQFVGTRQLDEALATLQNAKRPTMDELVSMVLDLQQRLIDLLEQLANSGPPPEVQQVIADLAEFERQATRQLGHVIVTRHDA
jgi:hypothetical protein